MTLQTAKGTKDAAPDEMVIKEAMFESFKRIFKLHGGQPLETPTFELREILTNKYGEDSKLIYNLAEDDTKQKLSLRYDLTVPFARYLCQNSIVSMRKYQIGKSFRRDRPSFNTGRFREFYQVVFLILLLLFWILILYCMQNFLQKLNERILILLERIRK